MTSFRIFCSRHPDQVVAWVNHDPFLDWWVQPQRCDLEGRPKRPLSGYKFQCEICWERASASKGSLHDALRRIHAHNQNAPPDQQIHDLSIQGLRTLHRTPGAGLELPRPPSDGGGLFVPGRSEPRA